MKNFSLSLYAFHLRQTLTDAPDSVANNAANLWENLVKLAESLPFIELKKLRSHLICYHDEKYTPAGEEKMVDEWLTSTKSPVDLGYIATESGFKIQGNLQPFRLNDTYAVDVTLFPETATTEIDINQLKYFQPNSLLPASINASLGQTFWLSAEVDANEDCQDLANRLAVALLAGTSLNSVKINQDKLFGSLLFEYEAFAAEDIHNPAKQIQILIWLNNNQNNTAELAEKSYMWLLNWLCCRHKLRFIYQEARNRYPEARQLYSHLEGKIQSFSKLISDSQTRLKKLKNLLEEIPQSALDYSRCLRDLQAHHTAINTNIINYRTCLKNLKASGNIPKTWQDFLNIILLNQKQIQTDINYLSPGQELFSQIVNTIRGIVAIDQAESDRKLEETLKNQEDREQKREKSLEFSIAIIGIGLAFSGISAQTAAKPVETILTQIYPQQSFDCPKAGLLPCLGYSGFYVLFHVGIGVIAALVVGLIIKQYRGSKK